jgi:hypothetical protein
MEVAEAKEAADQILGEERKRSTVDYDDSGSGAAVNITGLSPHELAQ